MQVARTKALDRLLELNKRIKVVKGGTSAGKTICILLILIDYAIRNDGKEISVVSESIPHLRRGAFKDFCQLLKGLGRYNDNQLNKSVLKYTFTNGSYIEFFSTDQSDKLRGARRTDLYINECNNVPFDAYNQLAVRTSGNIWLDYNPSSLFWVDKEIIGQEDADYITLTYKDNEVLDQAIVKEIEKAREKAKTSTYWSNWWRVYGLGETGSLEGVCIPDWKEIDRIPEDARLLAHGVDFGWNDPTVIISLYKWNEAYIADEMFYKSNTTLRDLSLFIRNNNITENLIADSAEPKSIEILRRDGHPIYPCTKGRDSVNFGINLINQNEIYVTSRSRNLKRELQGYVWAKDKEGNTLNKPTGEHPDCIDSLRYVLTDQLENPHKGEYFIY